MNFKYLFAIIFSFLLSSCIYSCSKDSEAAEDTNKETPKDEENDNTQLDNLPETRKKRLSKGLNLAHWFAQQKEDDYSQEYINNRFTENDFSFIKSSGFTYVRLSINEKIIYIDPYLVNAENAALLDKYIQKFIDNGIGVLVDFHPNDDFKEQIYNSETFANNIMIFWGKFAKHLSKFDPEYVFLEVLNEPSTENATEWNEIQKKWVETIRKNAPKHTIVVDGNLRLTKDNWDDIAAVMSIELFADKNIAYNFHYYQPFEFTHQGATWGWEVAQYTDGLKYPMNEQNCNDIINKNPNNTQVKWAMENYISTNWSKETFKEKMKVIADWSKEHNIFVTTNEIGAYYSAKENGKNQYIKDLREVLEEYGIGWAIWEYDDGFSIVTKDNGNISFDPGIKEALGF